MRLAKITGTVTATVKHPALAGKKLLLAEFMDPAGKAAPSACLAVDACGAGVGDTVIVTSGSAARMAAGLGAAPVDLSVIAIVDRIDLA